MDSVPTPDQSTKFSSSKRSLVWKIFRRIGTCEDEFGLPLPATYNVQCALCSLQMKQIRSNTTNMMKHIKNHHEEELRELLEDEGETSSFESLVKVESNEDEMPEPLQRPSASKRQAHTTLNMNTQIKRLKSAVDQLRTSVDKANTTDTSNVDIETMFGRMVAMELKSFCPAAAYLAKIEIFKVLAEIHKKNEIYLEQAAANQISASSTNELVLTMLNDPTSQTVEVSESLMSDDVKSD